MTPVLDTGFSNRRDAFPRVRRIPKVSSMSDQPSLPQRKSPATAPIVDIGNRSNLIFITVCTKNRAPILANEATHNILNEAWRDADAFYVGRYIILPDHIHLFCAPAVFPPHPFTNGSNIGKHWRRNNGPLMSRSLFGKNLVGTGNCDLASPILRNGNMYPATQFATN